MDISGGSPGTKPPSRAKRLQGPVLGFQSIFLTPDAGLLDPFTRQVFGERGLGGGSPHPCQEGRPRRAPWGRAGDVLCPCRAFLRGMGQDACVCVSQDRRAAARGKAGTCVRRRRTVSQGRGTALQTRRQFQPQEAAVTGVSWVPPGSFSAVPAASLCPEWSPLGMSVRARG